MTKTIAIYLASPESGREGSPHPDYAQMFEALLAPHMQGWKFETFHIAGGEFPDDPAEFDGVIITGSVSNITEPEPWYQTLFEHIRRMDASKTKLLAICFGHQAVATALGGKVEYRDIVLGSPTIEIITPRDWMHPHADRLRLFAGNFQQVTELPEGMVLLASSPDCPIAMAEKGAHILSLQFHPEFDAAYMQYYIDMIAGKISDEVAAAGRAGVDAGSDGAVFGRYAAAFLAG